MQRRALGGAEAGETLVEILVTIAVLGISMVAILGALWTTLRVADANTKTSDASTAVRAFAEAMKQGSASDPNHYVPCASTSTYTYTPTAPFEDYTASVTKVRYLSGFTGDTLNWSDTCPATDAGLQELTLRIHGPNNDPDLATTETVTVVKRDATQDLPRCEVIECTEDSP